ncbi:MAG: heavy metal translocating P-type ATPase [Nitrospiria bacterium]
MKMKEINESRTVHFSIGEMDCPDCGFKIEKRIRQVNGVEAADVNFLTTLLTVKYHPSNIEIRTIEQEVEKLGYSIKKSDSFSGLPTFHFLNKPLFLTVGSLILTMIGFFYSFIPSSNVAIPIYLAAIGLGGYPIARKGMLSIRQWIVDMNVLMTLAILGAMILGDYLESASVVVLFSFAQWLETYSVDQSRKAIRKLIDVTPTQATVRREDLDHIVRVDQVNPGETVVVRPGEKIPFDGKILKGKSSVNQASMTGESSPVDRNVNDEVFAGTLNLQGTLEIEVSHSWKESRMARILHMVEEAASRKASAQRFFEMFSVYYTPVIIMLAFLIAFIPPIFMSESWAVWFYRGLVLVVIACPCALIISTPVTVISGLSTAARHGVLIKGGLFLEELGRIKSFVFDKTGTLTTGMSEVTEVLPLSGSSRQVVQVAASLEKDSKHPIGEAIVRYANQEKIPCIQVSEFQSFPGFGVTGIVSGQTWIIGNHKFIEEKKLCSERIETFLRPLELKGNTSVLIGNEKEVVGIISLSDSLRPEAEEGLKGLRLEGIENISMITGDNQPNAAMIASKLNLDSYHAEILPDEKANMIGQLRKRFNKVAMVGDGINDAPALAAATVGIAMGERGTDVSLETADVVLMADNLLKLSFAVRLGKGTLRLIQQNLFLSVGIKALFLVLAISGLSTLWMAVAADTGVSLLVIANGMRVTLIR